MTCSTNQENRYLHCSECLDEGSVVGLQVFVTPFADLGVQCVKHKDFVMVVRHEKVQENLLAIATKPCENPECECEKEVSH
jgi:hypothetical protein